MMFDDALLPVLAGVLGLLFGSFLNVCIFRIPKKESVVTGASHCTACGTPIHPRDLIPVLSYLLLRGRCRACHARISMRYPLIELANAAAWVLVALRFGFTTESLIYCAFASVLLVAAMIDLDTMLVPPSLTVFILVLGAVSLFVLRDVPFTERLIGLAVGGLPFLLVAVVTRGGMGGGDIKLMAVCGLVLGWRLVLLSLLVSVVAGGVYAAVLLLTKRSKKGAEMPLVPFLSGGMFVCLLWGGQLLSWYLGMFL